MIRTTIPGIVLAALFAATMGHATSASAALPASMTLATATAAESGLDGVRAQAQPKKAGKKGKTAKKKAPKKAVRKTA